jgi:hypothetical protein
VVSDKKTGILGSCIINIANFGYDMKYLTHKIPLEDAMYQGSYVVFELASPITRPSL